MRREDLRDVFNDFKFINDKGVIFIDSNNNEKFKSYKDIYKSALKVSRLFTLNNIPEKGKVIFQIDSNELFIYAFWACIYSGVIAMPLEPIKNKESENKFKNICNTMGNVVVLTTKEIMAVVKSYEHNFNVNLISIEDYLNVNEYEIEENEINESQNKIAFVQFSSGSTGKSKGIMLTHKNLLTNIRAIQKKIELKNYDIGLSWLPLTHDMGLIGFHLTPSVMYINHVLIETRLFIYKPNLWLKYIDKYKATISCSPNFGYKFLLNYLIKKDIKDVYELSTIRLIFNGAEPISAKLIREFEEYMIKYKLKKNVVFAVYGLAEASLAVAFTECGQPLKSININKSHLSIGDKIQVEETGLSLTSVGKALKGVKIEIRDDEKELNENELGKIYISGENVCEKLLINDEEKNILDCKGFLFTGDIGFFYENELYILGRESEIIINGKNYYCIDAEEILENNLELKNQVVILPIKQAENEKDKVVAFIKSSYDHRIIECVCELKEKILVETSINLNGILFIKSIPKTTSGKIKRFQLLEDFYKNRFGEIIYFDDDNTVEDTFFSTEEVITNIFKSIYEVRVHIEEDLTKITRESIDNIIFLIQLEEYFKVKLDYNMFAKITTIRQMAESINEIKNLG